MPILHGIDVSPFVRKVRIALAIKGIAHTQNLVSPLGKIPCWEDGDFALPDSSCILAYLEKVAPQPALYPADPKDFGRALWFEEYADTKLVEVTVGLFFERVIKPKVLKAPTDEARVRDAIESKAPEVFAYLESQAPRGGDAIVGGRFSVADIALGSQFVNIRHAALEVDAKRWPRLAAYVGALHVNPWFEPRIEEERAQLAAR